MEPSLLAVLGTLAGTVVGFALNEASYLVRTRREERQRLGRVLKELLEIRSQTKLVPTLMEVFKAKVPTTLPPPVDFAIRQMLRNITSGMMQGIQQRYNQAVTEISGAFPVLAYQLTAKDMLVPLLREIAPHIPTTDTSSIYGCENETSRTPSDRTKTREVT